MTALAKHVTILDAMILEEILGPSAEHIESHRKRRLGPNLG